MPEEVLLYMQGKVEICGVNTSKLAVLDSATTRRLLLRVRQGDKSAGPVKIYAQIYLQAPAE